MNRKQASDLTPAENRFDEPNCLKRPRHARGRHSGRRAPRGNSLKPWQAVSEELTQVRALRGGKFRKKGPRRTGKGITDGRSKKYDAEDLVA